MPHELSGGQRQRVALARALAANPKFLLLDEPFAALDATVRRDLRRWLRTLHEETHVTTLLVTHDADEAMEIADRIVLLAEGSVVQSGTPQTLYAEPRTPFAMRFLGETSCFEKDGREIYVRPHDIRVESIGGPANEDVVHAHAERLVDYGARMHVELRLDHGPSVVAEVRPGETGAEAIRIGARYALRFLRTRTFTTEAPMGISA
jgi:sulfate transport system ATP-binding protein